MLDPKDIEAFYEILDKIVNENSPYQEKSKDIQSAATEQDTVNLVEFLSWWENNDDDEDNDPDEGEED